MNMAHVKEQTSPWHQPVYVSGTAPLEAGSPELEHGKISLHPSPRTKHHKPNSYI